MTVLAAYFLLLQSLVAFPDVNFGFQAGHLQIIFATHSASAAHVATGIGGAADMAFLERQLWPRVVARTRLNPRRPMPKIVFENDPRKQRREAEGQHVEWVVFGEYVVRSGEITIYTLNIVSNAFSVAARHHVKLTPKECWLAIRGTIAHEMLHHAYSLRYHQDAYHDHVRMKKSGDLAAVMRYLARHEHVRRQYIVNDVFSSLNQEIDRLN